MNHTSNFTWLLGCLGFAFACSSKVDDGSGTGQSMVATLDGRTFLSTSVTGRELVAGTEIRLRFNGNELSASAGCNSMFGPYRIDAGILRISGLGMTEIDCFDALPAQDEWLADLLQSSPTITLDEPELTLHADTGTITFLDREVASPDLPLVGTRWLLNAAANGDAATAGTGFDRATLTFDAAGSLTVFTACQTGTGQYSVDASTIQFEGFSYDGAACPDASVEHVSQVVLSVLDGAPVTYSIEEARLTIEQGVEKLYFNAGG